MIICIFNHIIKPQKIAVDEILKWKKNVENTLKMYKSNSG